MSQVDFSTIPKKVIEAYKKFPDRSDFIPIYCENNHIYFWVINEEGIKKADYLSFSLDMISIYEVKSKQDFLKALEEAYTFFEEETTETEEENIEELNETNIIGASYTDAPIVRLVNQTIIKAVKLKASDIHFEGRKDNLVIRFRIDGVLSDYRTYSKKLQDAVISRIKVMAGLDVAETRRPQDGAIRVNVGARTVDIRVSIVPSIAGEKAVLRILDTSQEILGLSDIGLNKKDVDLFKQMLLYPNGIILVTGPTGSGKTTTLYAALKEIAGKDKNIITIEDPIEYRFDGITQVQVNPKIDLTFANALKYFLRQDPDVILVGEIRDVETARMAIAASLTGHLVLSTLHTNDASTTLARLIDMGVEPFLLASSILLVIGQRLVKKICPYCAKEVETAPETFELLREYGINLPTHLKGQGCEHCRYSGFMGRTGIFEVMKLNEAIKKLIIKKADATEIEKVAVEQGMKTMFMDGIEKVKNGITTPEEVLLVTRL